MMASQDLIKKVEEWALLNGMCMRSKEFYDQGLIKLVPITLYPTPFPQDEFEKARILQILLNEVMHVAAYNHDFLTKSLKDVLDVDDYTAKLFHIYEEVYKEGFEQVIRTTKIVNADTSEHFFQKFQFCVNLFTGKKCQNTKMEMSLGLFRADYMVDTQRNNNIKLVEVNTISTSFAGLASKIKDYQKFVLRELGRENEVSQIPENSSAHEFGLGLVDAWRFYNEKKAAILFVEEIATCNIFDQRILEFKIKGICPEITVIRLSLTALINKMKLGTSKQLYINDLEIAVVYYRAGYTPVDYLSAKEWDVRLLIEKSKAIKCPSIQYHLAGTKKIQQKLSEPGALEKLISDPEKLSKIKEVFVGLYSLDLNADGDRIVQAALNNPTNFVLKPQLEGGGNNFYGNEMKLKLDAIKQSKERTQYILMDMLNPPKLQNYILRGSADKSYSGEVISELGIYGVILGNKREIMINKQVGHVLRTKPASEDEGGIILGTGSLDGPLLS